MKGITYSLRLIGLKTPPGTLPLVTLAALSKALLDGCERSLRLAVEGASVKKGPVPAWLANSLDFTFSGMSKGSTVLDIEVQTLGEVAPDQVRQQDLWYTLPDPQDTALTLLSRAVADATSEQVESERFDRGVLNKLLAFRSVLDKDGTELDLTSERRPRDGFKLSMPQLARIERLEEDIPEPHAVVVAGSFNLIEHSNRRFQLTLADGRRITGKADVSVVTEEDMRALWGKAATVKGMAHFNPSGGIRFIEATVIKALGPGEQVFRRVPDVQPPLKLVEGFKRQRRPVSPLKEVWGQWPGDESIEDLLSLLRETSAETT